jgi:DNA topoisomerase-1
MAKSPTRGKKKSGTRRPASPQRDATGKHLVIVESPAKAKTINQYLGSDYVGEASIGHVRDLPTRAPKGSKQPVPGVDLENDFAPTYEVLAAKKKTVTALKKAAKGAADVWFATDLDREGEAIAWHLAQELGVDPAGAKRVIFNAITKGQIEHAFANPHTIDPYKVNAQQARRILDRIVGYQVSPLLWKKVARGLSAGRVQSVAVRLVVERERAIQHFVPDESWRVTGRFALDSSAAAGLRPKWLEFLASVDEKGKGPSLKSQLAWLAEQRAVRGELIEVGDEKLDLGCASDDPQDLTDEVARVAEAAGLVNVSVQSQEDPEGRGPARWRRTVVGEPDPAARYRVGSIQTKRTSSKPPPPFITASLQAGAASSLSFSAQRTMRVAQSLYEGVEIKGEGQVGLITYMRTDSTHLAEEAMAQVRDYVGRRIGTRYVPKHARHFDRGKAAQEAHEAIRPTDVRREPGSLAGALNDEQLKLYRLIWSRFVACQMAAAEWDATAALLTRIDRDTGCVFKATGRVLVFDGWYRVTGVRNNGEEQMLPDLTEGQELAPFAIDPEQLFTSPPPRYSEASLVKALESEGIGRPSTYASIIQVIQDRNYVEQLDRRFYATDLGEVVTDKLVEAFPQLMDMGYTRRMEEELDKIEEKHTDWITMLRRFYTRFSRKLEEAHESLTHAKAELQPAIYKCPRCGSPTCYRFGKNGRFLSCTSYPDCDYAAPIDRDGRPMLPERVNVACPADGSQMELRRGRFGPFLASVRYPEIDYVINIDKKGLIKYPSPPPLETDLKCPKCEAPLYLRRGARGPWLGCSRFPKCRGRSSFAALEKPLHDDLLKRLEIHERANPQIEIHTLDGRLIPPGTPVSELVIPGGVADLEIHPSAEPRRARSA